MEQIPPTLATKQDLADAIAPRATKAKMREEGERTQRHFDVVAEGLRGDIRVLTDGIARLREQQAPR